MSRMWVLCYWQGLCTPISASSKVVALLTIIRLKNSANVSVSSLSISTYTCLSKWLAGFASSDCTVVCWWCSLKSWMLRKQTLNIGVYIKLVPVPPRIIDFDDSQVDFSDCWNSDYWLVMQSEHQSIVTIHTQHWQSKISCWCDINVLAEDEIILSKMVDPLLVCKDMTCIFLRFVYVTFLCCWPVSNNNNELILILLNLHRLF